MFKSLFALARGHANDTAEAVADANAPVILRQHMRDSTLAVERARKAVAVAIAQNEAEARHSSKLAERIADIEKRTIAAIEQGKDDLAREAAETIALLEAEREASLDAQRRAGGEIERLKRIVREAQAKLRELQRGQRIAIASESTRTLKTGIPNSGLAALKDAEATLARMRDRQTQIEATDAAMAELDIASDPGRMTVRLAEAGCGTPLHCGADSVLERLSKKARKPGKAS